MVAWVINSGGKEEGGSGGGGMDGRNDQVTVLKGTTFGIVAWTTRTIKPTERRIHNTTN